MSVESLTRVLPPPQAPLETGLFDEWEQVELTVGVSLPHDFKEFIKVFGTGRICGLFYLLNPFSKNEHLNLINQVPIRLDALSEIRKGYPAEVPYPIFPEPSGLLPWAYTDNGDVFYWRTQGAPDAWTVVLQDTGFEIWEEYNDSLSGFLERLLGGEIRSVILGTEILSNPDRFSSSSFLP